MSVALARLAALISLAIAPVSAEEPLPPVDAPPPAHVDLAPRGPSVASRLDEIHRRVQEMAVYPPLARERSVEGETLVSFAVDARGGAEDVRTERSSGSVALDRAAERAVLDADRLPYVYGRVVVPVVFRLLDAPADTRR